ncbi:MAG: DUF1893 domain-containing protein [Staphylococcus sp.]|nr:DUF1893 domain-containing protein [Staphylococcus sp.]
MALDEATRQRAIGRLHEGDCSCVIVSAGGVTTVCHERGVKDLYRLLTTYPSLLDGAFIADKVVGKGAAAIMVAGKVAGLFTDVVSEPALHLLEAAGVPVSYGRRVANIINRRGDGPCPVESLCRDCLTAEECLPIIGNFLENISKKQI